MSVANVHQNINTLHFCVYSEMDLFVRSRVKRFKTGKGGLRKTCEEKKWGGECRGGGSKGLAG